MPFQLRKSVSNPSEDEGDGRKTVSEHDSLVAAQRLAHDMFDVSVDAWTQGENSPGIWNTDGEIGADFKGMYQIRYVAEGGMTEFVQGTLDLKDFTNKRITVLPEDHETEAASAPPTDSVVVEISIRFPDGFAMGEQFLYGAGEPGEGLPDASDVMQDVGDWLDDEVHPRRNDR